MLASERSTAAGATGWLAEHAGVAGVGVLWIAWALNYNPLAIVDGDSTVQYTLVRRIFGADVDAIGYHFGLALLEAPFYAAGKALSVLGLSTVHGAPATEAAVTLGSSFCVLLAVLLAASLLSSLELPARGIALLTALFGTPLFYYGSFTPARTHAFDAMLLTVAFVLLYRYVQGQMVNVRLAALLGAVLGFSATVRYFAAPGAVVLVSVLLTLRRPKQAAVVGAAAVATFGLLLLVPWSVGAPLTGGGYGAALFDPHPLNPLKMLFTEHRGLFVWSPIALLGAIGYVRMLVVRPRDRTFLAIGGLMAVGVMASYSAVSFWDGTWSFSQRFFTPFFPLVVIGVAGLVAWRPRLATSLALVAAAWSVYLALTLQTVGPPHNNYSYLQGGAFDVARQVAIKDVGPGEYLWGVYNASRLP